jgi:hypothetical protein
MNFDDLENEWLEEADNLPAVIEDEERKRRQDVLKQRSGEALTEKWRGEDRKKLETAMAAVAPPAIVKPRCHVCQSPHRLWIERMLVKGMAYKAISDQIPDGPDRRSISRHYKEDMALDQQAIRALLEEEADLLGQNYEEGVRGAITLRGMLDVLIRKGYEDAISGITTVEIKDISQMMKLYKEMNADTGNTAVEEARTAIEIFKGAIQNVLIKGDIIDRPLGMELLQAISDEVEVLRKEQDITQQVERQLLPPNQ